MLPDLLQQHLLVETVVDAAGEMPVPEQRHLFAQLRFAACHLIQPLQAQFFDVRAALPVDNPSLLGRIFFLFFRAHLRLYCARR